MACVNLALIGVIIAAILMSATWNPGVTFMIMHVEVELQNVLRDAIFSVSRWRRWR